MGDSASARYRLQRMISTREADLLNGMPPNSMEELEEYAEGTVAQLLLLQVRKGLLVDSAISRCHEPSVAKMLCHNWKVCIIVQLPYLHFFCSQMQIILCS